MASLSLGGCFGLRSRSGSVAVLQSGDTEWGCGCVGSPMTPWSPPSPSPRPRCPLLGPLLQLPLPHPPTPSCAPAPSGSSPATERRDPMENPQVPRFPPPFWGAEGNISAFFCTCCSWSSLALTRGGRRRQEPHQHPWLSAKHSPPAGSLWPTEGFLPRTGLEELQAGQGGASPPLEAALMG